MQLELRPPPPGGSAGRRDRVASAPSDADDRRGRRGRRGQVLVGLGVAGLAGVLVWLTMARLTGSASLFLSPDGGHYLTDAGALVGDGVRPLAHPVAFPTLVALSRGLVSPVGQVQLALGFSYWLMIVALYVLCRQFSGAIPSIAGAGVGATFPAVGELLAWNGGATLIATALLGFTLAACERWLRDQRWPWALAVGGAAAATLLAHPFVAAVAFLCVAARWLVELIASRRRSGSARSGPFGVRQLLLVAIPVVVAVPVALPYYSSVEADAGVRFGVPRLGAIWDTLVWGLREQGVLLLIFLVCLIAMALSGRASATIAGALVAVYLVVSSATRADPSYRTRVAYLLPIIGAIGTALLFTRYAPPLVRRLRAGRPDRAPVIALAVAVVAVMMFASLGFLPRLPRAAAFYQRLDPIDVQALASLRSGGPGLVAASWNQNAYGHGISNAWYVEGLADRKAAGPTDPALSTIRREQVDGADMQQFFAGEAGIENGALQLSVGPQEGVNDPGVQAMIGGMYRPILYVNDEVSAYPAPLGRDAKEFRDLRGDVSVRHDVTGSGITGSFATDENAEPRLEMRAELDGRRVRFEYRLGEHGEGPMTVRLFPGYGLLWRDARQDSSGFRFVADPFTLTGVTTAGARGVPVTIVPRQHTKLRFVERDPQFGLQSVELTVRRGGNVAAFDVVVDGDAPLHRPAQFDQASLVNRHDITHVVLWKDTGWKPRFADQPCFTQTQETFRLLIYDVDRRCLRSRR